MIAIIPARGGSTRIPRKNIRDFYGKPIIAYPIKTAQECGVFDEVYVTTEDNEIADVALNYGATVIKRPPELAVNDVGTHAVMQHALKLLGHSEACCIYPCTPLLDPEDLITAEDVLCVDLADFVAPVGKWLEDPGQFYFGSSWLDYDNMMDGGVVIMRIEERRAIDINTEEDWQRAMKAYREIYGN